MNGRGSSREDTVRRAVAEWTRRLVNLDGRNRMLYFRELTKGTLEISPDREGVRRAVVEHLLSGEPVRLSDLFEPEALPDPALRVLALAAKARSNFEEKGLATLYIGHSFARWTRSDGHTPRAPVALLPVRIKLEGAGGDDALIEWRGEAEINPSFAYAMRQDLGADPYPPSEERSENFRDWLPQLSRACAPVDDFSLDGRLFLANLEFSKLPMVVDMEQHLPLFVENDLVAAIAGYEPAVADLEHELEISADLPDHTPPQDEYLVCDADASQSYVIAAALRGESVVVHGPPGTGKSQTIANLISSLAAQGKTVLFVAEKRAAIGAVTRRLDDAGCGELVLDLHDGSGRRHVAKSLRASIQAVGPLVAHEAVSPHEELASTRKQLVAHRRQMHRPREPHGLSFFELQAMLGTPDHEVTGVRLVPELLGKWTADGRATATSLLGQWQSIAERVDQDPTGLWGSSLIGSPADAAESTADVEHLVTVLIPAVEDAFRSALAELAVPADSEIPIAAFADFLTTVDELADRYEPAFVDNSARIARTLAPAERSLLGRAVAWLVNAEYRWAKRTIQDLGVGGGDALTMLDDARRADEARSSWASWFPGRPLPGQASSAAPLASALHHYGTVRDRLTGRVPRLGDVGGFREEDAAIRALHDNRHLADSKAELSRIAAALGEFGLGPLLRLTPAGQRDRVDLADMATRVFAASAIDAITWQEPELAMFSGASHQQIAKRYADLDRRHMRFTAQRVMRKVAERAAVAMKERPRETALVQHEVDARDHHMPVRQLLTTAPNVVKALRPCWAMSPLLVSQTLPAAADLFDVVIFDEASQILPIHAIPSISRAGQVVVAGDPHQLPPSQFSVAESLADEAEQELLSDAAVHAADSESILDVLRELLLERNLLWHYRSQDERLINFPNTHTYDRSLVSFPGTNRGTGIRQVLVEGTPDNPEGTASNPEVVREVVELILEHAAGHPDESLGVIAMGVRHANDITSALRLARVEQEDDFGGFFEDKGAEPFFVKIMAMAQGDERDHIILSMGYGRNPKGEIVYRWGSLARKGGERRLNVAVTRAKRRMTVVSSVAAGEIDRSRTRSRGAALLAEYLEYAEKGGESIVAPDTGPLTAFEISVRDRLIAANIPLEPHYGGGPLRIDFAAFDGEDMTRPVLAIETDGLGYNSSQTARDRDRLRLEVLRKRGWRYHRLWSIDWYRDPEGEAARAVAAWEKAVVASRDPALSGAGRALADRPVVAGRGRSPISVRKGGILGYQRSELVQLIRWIQSDGIERSEDDMLAAAMDVLGFTDSRGRVGRALRGAIQEANH